MKHDIKEMSYVFQKDKQDRDLIYKIDVLLYNQFENYFVDGHKDVSKAYFDILEDREGIIDLIISQILEEETINEYKLFYLVDMEFKKQLDKSKRYYLEHKKVENKIKDKDLYDRIMDYMLYCFNGSNNDIKSKLHLIGSYDFRLSTIKELKIKVNDYEDFDKVFNKCINDFRKLHKYDIEEGTQEQEEDIGFGWKVYAILKIIEALFKM